MYMYVQIGLNFVTIFVNEGTMVHESLRKGTCWPLIIVIYCTPLFVVMMHEFRLGESTWQGYIYAS